MSRKTKTQYVGNTPGFNLTPKKKRKGSKNNYKPPADVRQKRKDQAYVEFQTVPKLNEVTKSLVRDKPRCDTILGGTKIWVKKRRPNGTEYKFPIIIDGVRCPNDANRTFRIPGENKNLRRCGEHNKEDYWVED
jgi:hypothetical protein